MDKVQKINEKIMIFEIIIGLPWASIWEFTMIFRIFGLLLFNGFF